MDNFNFQIQKKEFLKKNNQNNFNYNSTNSLNLKNIKLNPNYFNKNNQKIKIKKQNLQEPNLNKNNENLNAILFSKSLTQSNISDFNINQKGKNFQSQSLRKSGIFAINETKQMKFSYSDHDLLQRNFQRNKENNFKYSEESPSFYSSRDIIKRNERGKERKRDNKIKFQYENNEAENLEKFENDIEIELDHDLNGNEHEHANEHGNEHGNEHEHEINSRENSLFNSIHDQQTYLTLENWNEKEVAMFLNKNQFGSIAKKFLKHKILGRHLLKLNSQLLMSMGIYGSETMEFLDFLETLKPKSQIQERIAGKSSQLVITYLEGTNTQVAVKIRQSNYETHKREVQCLTHFRSRYVVELIHEYTYNDGETNYVVMEKGDVTLQEVISANKFSSLEPFEVRYIVRTLFHAVHWIHNNGYVHGNLTPAKVMEFTTEGNTSKWKLIGFGSCDKVGEPIHFYDKKYCPPEVARHTLYPRYYRAPVLSEAIDVWALGMITLELFLGRPLFENTPQDRILEDIASDKSMVPNLDGTDELAHSFFAKILCKNPQKRGSLHNLMMHPFITGLQTSHKMQITFLNQRIELIVKEQQDLQRKFIEMVSLTKKLITQVRNKKKRKSSKKKKKKRKKRKIK